MKKVLISILGIWMLALLPCMAGAVGPSETIINVTPMKATPIQLYGGAINASVTSANATEFSMVGYNGGELDIVSAGAVNSCNVTNGGNMIMNFAVQSAQTSQANGGQYTSAQIMASSYANYIAYPNPTLTLSAASNGSLYSVMLKDLRMSYLKLVPTVTNACNVNVYFTPSYQ